MFIQCENCSTKYDVPDDRIQVEHPHFFKCTHCGFVFEVPKTESNEYVPDFLQDAPSDPATSPMALQDIFAQPVEELDPNVDERNHSDVPEVGAESLFEAPLEPKEEPDESANTLFDSSQTPIFGNTGDDVFAPIVKDPPKLRFTLFLFAFCVTALLVFYILYIGRFYFVRQTPSLEKIYRKAGISTDVVGQGLAFQNTLFDGIQVPQGTMLTVQSELVNTTNKTLKVPHVVILLLDDNGVVVEKQNVNLMKENVDGAERIPFKAEVPSLPEQARRVEITFER